MIVPRFRLAALPTPLERMPRLEKALRTGELFVKRDDLTGFELGGNKARKLEFLIGDALAQDTETLIVMGGPTSNLCRTAALAARVAGMRCELVLYGEEPPAPPLSLELARAYGAHTIFTGDPDRSTVEERARERARQLAEDGVGTYSIPRGGATGVGAVGYHLAVQEVADQLEREYGIQPRSVVVAVGSGGTIAGMVSGAAALGLDWNFVAASVSRDPEEVTGRIEQVAAECSYVMGTPKPQWNGTVIDARGPGYGREWEPATEVAERALVAEGLLLDPVYTSKSMAALSLDPPQPPVLWWHTGGTVTAIDRLTRRVAHDSE